jgi:hypothetical protein
MPKIGTDLEIQTFNYKRYSTVVRDRGEGTEALKDQLGFED